MKPKYLVVLAAIALSHGALAADARDRTYPVDDNPACMDRSKDATSPECTPQTEGKPRHYIKPVKPVAPPAQKPAAGPPESLVRPKKAP